MVSGIVIPAAGEEPLEERDFLGLEDYQAAVGGWIEAVDIATLGVTVYVNEEGLLRHLPFNSRATFLWWHEVPGARQTAMLVGDAVIVGLPDGSGESTDVSGLVSDQLLRNGKWIVEVKIVGATDWVETGVTYSDQFEAMAWAMVAAERLESVQDARAVPVLTEP